MYRKVISITVICVMLFGLLAPMQSAQAVNMDSMTNTAALEDSAGEGVNPSEGTTSEEKPDQPGENTSEEATNVSEENTSEENPGKQETPTPETPTPETPTPETPAPETPAPEQPVVAEKDLTEDPNYIVTNLSPARAKVVVLDPGHCKTHPGAYYNGLSEETVVLDIAKACQSKLDTYGDVTVYMTRTTGGCCKNLGLGDCLSCRTTYAKYLDADFLISMHINAGRSSGANALVPYKSGYHDNIRQEAQAFGKLALKKLQELGVANRGFLLRKSGTGDRYKNGKLADYYSIVRRGVIYNVPSVIIEHGYLSSASDCQKFFKTKAKRTKVGQADANAVIEYYGLVNKTLQGEMKAEAGGTCFVTSEGKKALGWVKYNGKWYYFDKKTGFMKTGMMEEEGESYFLDTKTGEMKIGWIKDGGCLYFARGDGSIVKNQPYSDGLYTYLFDAAGNRLSMGLHTMDGNTYYVNHKSRVLDGVLNIEGKYYLFDGDTKAMCYGYTKQGSKYYYADEQTGVLARNKIQTIGNARYYFDKKGVRQSGWVKMNKAKYYFSTANGKMVTGWKKIKGNYYYFSKADGKMQKNKWIGKYYVNSQGIRTKKK